MQTFPKGFKTNGNGSWYQGGSGSGDPKTLQTIPWMVPSKSTDGGQSQPTTYPSLDVPSGIFQVEKDHSHCGMAKFTLQPDTQVWLG